MIGDKLDILTDSELHRKLLQCGFPNVPVTETTRKILTKKLRCFLKNRREPKSQLSKINKNLNKNETAFEMNAKNIEFLKTNSSNINFRHNIKSNEYQMPHLVHQTSNHCNESHLNNSQDVDTKNIYGNIGVVNKLLKLRQSTNNQKILGKTSNLDEVVFFSPKQVAVNNFKMSYLINWLRERKKMFSMNGFHHTAIPFLLVLSFFLFLLIISTVYLTQIPQHLQPLDDRNVEYDVCYDHLSSNQFCIQKDYVQKAIDISQLILLVLSESARTVKCENINMFPTITLTDFLKVYSAYSFSELKAAAYIIKKNPQWNLLVDHSIEGCTGVGNLCAASDQHFLRFKLLDKRLQIKCSLSRKLHRFFTIIGCVSIITVLSFFVTSLVKIIKKSSLQKQEIVSKITSDINNILLTASTNQETHESVEFIVNHLRDKIIPLNQRKHMSKYWEKALQLIEHTDSRISFGYTLLNGEMCKTIKWNKHFGMNGDVYYKKWNSPAFDNRHRIIDPPTPCLKIRHMFDHSEINKPNLKGVLYKAILEKVGKSCEIIDFQIDIQTCCVYLRCASEKDAGTVHREINGWWFDKRLVSIKFLHLERYLQRFPKTTMEFTISNGNLPK